MHVVCMQLNLSTRIHINISKMKETKYLCLVLFHFGKKQILPKLHTQVQKICVIKIHHKKR